MASKNGKNNKKQVIDYSKKEKKVKDFIQIPVTNNEIIDGLVNGFEYIKTIRKFGKEYYYCKNNVSSL